MVDPGLRDYGQEIIKSRNSESKLKDKTGKNMRTNTVPDFDIRIFLDETMQTY